MKYCKGSSVAANIEFTSFDIYSITERKVRLSTQFHKSDNKQKISRRARKAHREMVPFQHYHDLSGLGELRG